MMWVSVGAHRINLKAIAYWKVVKEGPAQDTILIYFAGAKGAGLHLSHEDSVSFQRAFNALFPQQDIKDVEARNKP